MKKIFSEVLSLPEGKKIFLFLLGKPGGSLVLNAPDAESPGHEKFGRSWIALDLPRHLSVFHVSALRRLLPRAGFGEAEVRPSARNARNWYNPSALMERGGSLIGEKPTSPQPRARWFVLKEFLLRILGVPCGEEVAALAVKGVRS